MNSVSPTFVATFEDGEVVRMTTYNEQGRCDLRRGIALALAAYESRTKRRPPALVSAHFESAEGVNLLPHTADEIAKAMPQSEAGAVRSTATCNADAAVDNQRREKPDAKPCDPSFDFDQADEIAKAVEGEKA